MAYSQLKCLEDDQEFLDIAETSSLFYYSEKQRVALETLLSSGENAFQTYLKNEGMHQFLSKEEVISLEMSAVDSQLGKIDLDDNSELDDDLSISYWPGKSDVPTPMLDLGWPAVDTWKGITRAEVYTHPPSKNAPHIKVVVRRAIQSATKVIALVMDIFTDPDIFLDLYEAATQRCVPAYIILCLHYLPSFLHMAETLGFNVLFTENIRVRVISGCTLSTRQLKQVTGTLKEKFLLIDSSSVITGTYSFTWSDSRLDRNLITLLTGEITDSFDNEFRTLYAASCPIQRYDFTKDHNKDIKLPLFSSIIPVPKEKDAVVPNEPEPYTNGYSIPQTFNTSGVPQPTSDPLSPLINSVRVTQMTKGINNIAEWRAEVPETGKSIGIDSEYNRALPAPEDTSLTKNPVNAPDYLIRPGAFRNFEGPTLTFHTTQQSHSALSDILKNVHQNRISVAKTTGGRPSKSLWNLSQLSSYSEEQAVRQETLGPCKDSKGKRWSTKDTPAMLLMRQRAFPVEENRNSDYVHHIPFQKSSSNSPMTVQGHLLQGMPPTSLPKPWTNQTKHGRLQYY